MVISPFYQKQALALRVLQNESRDLRKKAMTAMPAAQSRLIEGELARVAASGDPIIVGPWLTEPGIELMFWVPLLRWFVERFGIEPARIVAVSRGGVQGWYEGIAARYVDAFSIATLDELRGIQPEWYAKGKPVEIHQWDHDLIERVRTRLGLERAAWIHPAMLFNFSRLIYNAGAGGDRLLFRMTRHRRLTHLPPPPELLADLPDEFVAIRFYTQARRGALWDNADTSRAIREFVRLLSARIPVVDLDPGVRLKDHIQPQWDFDYGPDVRVWRLFGRVPLEHNLGAQAWLISRARAFAGTLGGLSSIAPVTGVPALTMTSLDGYPFLTPYRRYSLMAFRQLGARYGISNPLHADLPRLVDAFVADITGGAPFPWPVGPGARADGGTLHPDDASFALVRVPDERWAARKHGRLKLRVRIRARNRRRVRSKRSQALEAREAEAGGAGQG